MTKQGSLAQKIVLAIAIPAALVAAILVAVFLIAERRLNHQWLLDTALARAQVIASNSTSSLAFVNQPDAEEILNSLATDPQVTAGALFDANGELFAAYHAKADGSDAPPIELNQRDGYAFRDDLLEIYQPVRQNDLWLGTLYLRFSLASLNERLRSFILSGIIAGLAATAIAVGLAYYLKGSLSRPILQLAEVARAVSRTKNYSTRAPIAHSTFSEAELLTHCFNEMLERIENQDASLRASERQFRRAISDAPIPIAIHDETGLALELSRGWKDICGQSDSELSNLFTWFEKRCSTEAYLRLRESVTRPKLSGDSENLGEIEIKLDKKRTRIWHANTTSIGRFQDGRAAWLLIAIDLTDRIQANNELMLRTAELERSNQELDDFAYIASHDMKEPLRGIHNNAMFLSEDYGDVLDEAGSRRITRMQYLCDRLEHLINDLLFYSRIGRQSLAIRETDLNEVVAEIIQIVETSREGEHGQIIVPKPLPSFVCDSVRVREVFRNLITNALKYNRSPEKIVEVGFLPEQSGRRDVFYVKDNGIGISPEFHREIFRIFKRLNPEAEDVKGTGSGLTFVKKIVERHEGEIWVDSALGEGSTFYFTLARQEVPVS